MPGKHDSTHIRITRTLKTRLEGFARVFAEWAANNPEAAPDYLLCDPVPVESAIMRLIDLYEGKKVRNDNYRARKRAARLRSKRTVSASLDVCPAADDTSAA